MTASPLPPHQLDQYLEYLRRNVLAAYEQVQRPDLWKVQPGSSLAGDDSASDPYQISHAVRGQIGVAVDNMHAAVNLLTEANVMHPMAPFSMIRTALETSANATWILQPKARSDRVLRRLRLAFADARDRDQAEADAGLTPNRPIADHIARLQAIGRQSGCDVGKIAATPPSATKILTDADADATMARDRSYLFTWRVSSGMAHGRDWAHMSLLTMEELEATRADERVGTFRLTAGVDRFAWVLGAALDLTQHAGRTYQTRATSHVLPYQ